MKLLNSDSQSDSNSSFLDVVLCLLVVFILLFAVAIVNVKKTTEKETKAKTVSKSEQIKEKCEMAMKVSRKKIQSLEKAIKLSESKLVESKRIESKKIQSLEETIKLSEFKLAQSNKIKENKEIEVKSTNRYKGRGGQPSIAIGVFFDNGFLFKIGKRAYSWEDFRKLICNINRQESLGDPSLLFSLTFDSSFDNISTEQLQRYFKNNVSRYEIKKAIESNSRFQIISLLKKADEKFEKSCRGFKIKFTTSEIGNWDGDIVGSRDWTGYNQRKSLDNPYL